MKNLFKFTFLILSVILISSCCTSCGDAQTFNAPIIAEAESPGSMLVEYPIIDMAGDIPSIRHEEAWVKYQDVKFETYGWMNKSDYKSNMIEYDWTAGNMFWSIVLFEMAFIPPILITGLDWYEPEALKPEFRRENIKVIRAM